MGITVQIELLLKGNVLLLKSRSLSVKGFVLSLKCCHEVFKKFQLLLHFDFSVYQCRNKTIDFLVFL